MNRAPTFGSCGGGKALFAGFVNAFLSSPKQREFAKGQIDDNDRQRFLRPGFVLS